MKFDNITIGQKIGTTFKIGDKDVMEFAMISGDVNHVHLGKDGIVHGMLVCAHISHLIGVVLPGDGTVWKTFIVRFVKPVYRHKRMEIRAVVCGKNHNDKTVEMYIDVYNDANELCVATTCTVKPPE